MTNKQIKELCENLESTLVSQQNQINQDRFNIKMLRSSIELKDELIFNRNKKIKEMSDKIEQFKRLEKAQDINNSELSESISNLEFLLEKKDKEIEELKRENSILRDNIEVQKNKLK